MAEVLGQVRKAGVGMVGLPQMNVEVESSPMENFGYDGFGECEYGFYDDPFSSDCFMSFMNRYQESPCFHDQT